MSNISHIYISATKKGPAVISFIFLVAIEKCFQTKRWRWGQERNKKSGSKGVIQKLILVMIFGAF